MGKLNNAIDLSKALGADFLTSTTRFHDHLSEYFSKRVQKKNEIYRDENRCNRSEDFLLDMEQTEKNFNKVYPYFAQLIALSPQVTMAALASIPLLDKDSSSASSLLLIVSTILATNDVMMRAFDKVVKDWEPIENGVGKFIMGDDYTPLEFEYDKQKMYPRFREALECIRSGDDGGEPPEGRPEP
tara:strand:- start:176 stop:733 length:558 start_codon:yes stop_codon:yes gene_type:complete